MHGIRHFLFYWFNSLFVRLTSIVLGFVIFLGAAGSWHLYRAIDATLLQAFEERTLALADQLSQASAVLISHGEADQIRSLVEQYRASAEVVDVLVVDSRARPLARLSAADAPVVSAPPTSAPGGGRISQIDRVDLLRVLANRQPTFWHDPNSLALAVPVVAFPHPPGAVTEVLGVTVVELNRSSITTQRRAELARLGLFNLILIFAMGSVISGLVFFSVVRPLHSFMKATQKIASGSFDAYVPVRGAREIADLAKSFNRMAFDLQNSMAVSAVHMNEMRCLYEIGAAISQHTELEGLLATLANKLSRLAGGSGALLVLWDEDRQELIPSAADGSFREGRSPYQDWPGEPTLTMAVIQRGKPLAVPDVYNNAYVSPRIAAQFPHKSMLGLPLVVKNRTIGAALIGFTRIQRSFSEHEIQTAMAAAGQIAAAIANAQLFAHLAAERNRLEDILNAVSDAILVTDACGRIQSGNRAFEALTGTKEAPAQDRDPWGLLSVPAEQILALRQEITEMVGQGQIWQRELVGVRTDGTTYDADINVSSIRNSQDQLAGYVICFRDITELKDVDRMKNRFVSTVSHELRTPISVINLHTENLLEFYHRLSDDQRLQMLRDIRNETETLHHLIEDLLSLSRLDSGRAEPRRKYFNLLDLLRESAASARVVAEEKRVWFHASLPNGLTPVFADRDQLGQVFRNLFSNAIKFSPAGGQVSLDLFVEHGEVVVQIADTGIGIPSADLPRVFDRFYRSELTVQREIPGTGLGLAISHEILKRHQGAIEVQSEVDKGTIFRVRLPLAREQRPQILLLDGAPGCLPAIRPVLDSEYHLVSTAHPTEALHLAKEAAPSLLMVVLDDAAADRVALIHSLRAAVHSRHIPILAISTGSHEMADQALLAGADDFITHPVSPAVLLGTTARLLSSSRAGRGTV